VAGPMRIDTGQLGGGHGRYAQSGVPGYLALGSNGENRSLTHS